jgi:hypothetical protein
MRSWRQQVAPGGRTREPRANRHRPSVPFAAKEPRRLTRATRLPPRDPSRTGRAIGPMAVEFTIRPGGLQCEWDHWDHEWGRAFGAHAGVVGGESAFAAVFSFTPSARPIALSLIPNSRSCFAFSAILRYTGTSA